MTRREVAYRITHSTGALPHASFTLWHAFSLPFQLLLIWMSVIVPGPLADLGSLVIGSPLAFVAGRVTVIIFCSLALYWVRGQTVVITFGLIATIVGMILRISVGQIDYEPLTLGTLIILIALMALPIKVILRPNSADKIQMLSVQRDAAVYEQHRVEKENAQLRYTIQRLDSQLRNRFKDKK